nr:CPPV313 ankyrin repeat protein [Cooks petrelpox virus]
MTAESDSLNSVITKISKHEQGCNLLQLAILHKSHINIIKLILDSGIDVNALCHYGSALHMAVCNACIETINIIIKYGANINISDSQGFTALYRASIENRPKVVETLLVNGANPNIKNKLGRTPLHAAVLWKKPNNVELLLKYGADINVVDVNKQTPLSFIQIDDCETPKLLVAHITLNNYTDKSYSLEGYTSNMSMIYYSKSLSSFKLECEKELSTVKSIKIGRNISLFSLFMLKNPNIPLRILEDLSLTLSVNNIRIYFNALMQRISYVKYRHDLIEEALQYIDKTFLDWNILSTNIKLYILKLLTTDDLKNILGIS